MCRAEQIICLAHCSILCYSTKRYLNDSILGRSTKESMKTKVNKNGVMPMNDAISYCEDSGNQIDMN